MTVIALFAIIGAYWLLVSLTGYYLLTKTFKHYSRVPKFPVPAHYQAFMRKDFGKWDYSQIKRGCFLKLPWKAFVVITYLTVFTFLSVLKFKVGFPEKLIELWRNYAGLLSIKTVFQLNQQFDRNQKIATPVTIANHVNWFDFNYIASCFRRHSTISKAEIQNIFGLNAMAKYTKCLYVDRNDANGRRSIIEQIKKQIEDFKKANDDSVNPLLIYPEGTVSNGRALMSFKNGAFQNLTPITIFSLRYECKQFHLGMDEVNAFYYTLIVLCLSPKLIAKKRVVQPKEGETVEEYRERCREILAEMGGFEIIDSNYKDIVQYERLKKAARSS